MAPLTGSHSQAGAAKFGSYAEIFSRIQEGAKAHKMLDDLPRPLAHSKLGSPLNLLDLGFSSGFIALLFQDRTRQWHH